jgi:mannitol-1-/sugar-/sorbitol-6-phosphatase
VQTFLFDIDGTLVDSTACVERVWRELAGEYGADADQVLRHCHGRRDVDVVAEFFAPAVSATVLARITPLEMELTGSVVPVLGASEVLRALAPGRWAAVTSGPRLLMQQRLLAAGLPVPSVMVTSEDVRAGKPDPEGFKKAAAALGVPTSKCIVFEDSPAGVAAGKAAGAFVVALTTTHSPDALAAADRIVPNLFEISAMLGSDVDIASRGSGRTGGP